MELVPTVHSGPLKRLLASRSIAKQGPRFRNESGAQRFGACERLLHSLDSGDPSRRSRANPVSAIIAIRLRGDEYRSIEFEFAEVLVVGEPPASRLLGQSRTRYRSDDPHDCAPPEERVGHLKRERPPFRVLQVVGLHAVWLTDRR